MKTAPGLEKDVSDYLWLLAENAVNIPNNYVPRKGGEWGRWTREDRVMVAWSVLCGIARSAEVSKKAKKV